VRVLGREIWLGKWGSPEADRKYRELLTAWASSGGTTCEPPQPVAAAPERKRASPSAPPPVVGVPLSVGSLLVQYMAVVKAEKPVDRKHAKWWLVRSVAIALDSRKHLAVSQFGPKMLAEVQRELATEPMPKTRSGHTHRSREQVIKIINAIRGMFAWGVSEEIVGPERLHALKTVKPLRHGEVREGDKRNPIPEQHLRTSSKKMPPVIADIVQFILLTGCRPDEALSLRMANVEQRQDAWRYVPPKHKNTHRGLNREVAIGPRAAAVVKRWATGKAPDELVWSAADLVPPKRSRRKRTTIPLRPRRMASSRITPERLRKLVARACEAAEVPTWTPYCLRHTRLQAVRDQYGLEAAAAIGGHSEARVTEEHYARESFGKAAAVAAQIG
jgi:integrase